MKSPLDILFFCSLHQRLSDGGSVTSVYGNTTFMGMYLQLDGVVIESLLTPMLCVIKAQSIFALKGNLFHSHDDI